LKIVIGEEETWQWRCVQRQSRRYLLRN